jgi:hypothetical protein
MNVDTGEFAALTAEAEALRAQSEALLGAFYSRLVQASIAAYKDGWADALGEVPPDPGTGARRDRLMIVR